LVVPEVVGVVAEWEGRVVVVLVLVGAVRVVVVAGGRVEVVDDVVLEVVVVAGALAAVGQLRLASAATVVAPCASAVESEGATPDRLFAESVNADAALAAA
jgi:hypothetical protein